MAMPALPLVTTIEEIWALPEDGLRHELLDGVHVVTPAPSYRHQAVLAALIESLRTALKNQPRLEVLSSPADIRLGPRTLVQPDLFILRINPASPPGNWQEAGLPLVAIEILSPGTARRDRGLKRRLYQEAGVGEYWVVDHQARMIERWTPGDNRPELIEETLVWVLGEKRVLELPLSRIFGPPAEK